MTCVTDPLIGAVLKLIGAFVPISSAGYAGKLAAAFCGAPAPDSVAAPTARIAMRETMRMNEEFSGSAKAPACS
jgi:hypothetical protein